VFAVAINTYSSSFHSSGFQSETPFFWSGGSRAQTDTNSFNISIAGRLLGATSLSLSLVVVTHSHHANTTKVVERSQNIKKQPDHDVK
jgi:hypothetical protein